MTSPIRLLLLIGISSLLAAAPVHAGEGKEDAGTACRTAADYFGNLDLDRAHRWAGTALRDAGETPEARQALLLKTLISAVKTQTQATAARRYVEAMRTSPVRDSRRRCLRIYLTATQNSILAGDVLVTDVKGLLRNVGTPMSVEIKKGYDSLELRKEAYTPYKMLKYGRAPTRREQKTIERHVSDMSFCLNMSRLLHGPNPAGSVAKKFEKKQVLKGDVDWAGLMTVLGDSIARYAATCQAGWIDPKLGTRREDPARAKEGYATARKCFEKVLELSKGTAGKGRMHARERIEDIDKMLKDMEKAKKTPSATRGARG